jgi:hypothetical protein
LNTFFLGLIAISVLIMAAIQVAALVYAARAARRLDSLSQQIERDIRPIFADLRAMSTEAARAMSVAASQVDRVDRLLGDLSTRVEQTFAMLQTKVIAPVREGMTFIAGVRTLVAALREMAADGRQGADSAVDEDDALFIG